MAETTKWLSTALKENMKEWVGGSVGGWRGGGVVDWSLIPKNPVTVGMLA